MQIPFKSIDGKNIANAEVEIPDQVLNHFAISVNEKGSILDLPHIRPGSFTRIMGDAALRFHEREDKLTIPDKEYKGIHITFPDVEAMDMDKLLSMLKSKGMIFFNNTEEILKVFGFQKREGASWWHPALGEDNTTNYILFDPKTDNLPLLVLKIFNIGWNVGSILSKLSQKKITILED